MNATTPLLQVENLSIELPAGLDRKYAVENLSYTLNAGEILCVVGESGSGKSMTANAIMGLLPSYLKPSSGRILLKGRDLLAMSEAELARERGRTVSMIFQEPLSALNPLMTVGDQIAEVMLVHGEGDAASREQRVLELLDYVGLPDPASLRHSYPFRLSGGQRQRVMIAMALALEPAMLIADEPTTALDVTTQAQILDLIRRIQRAKGMGVLFITHDFGVVADIADKVVVMEKGLVVEQGTADEVLNRPKHPYTRRLIAAVPHPDENATRADADGDVLLEVRGLRKTYRSGGGLFTRPRIVKAVDDVSFTLRRGETLGVVGESGSGKSTLGRCILKLTDVDGGQILYRGKDIVPLSQAAFRPLRRHLQMVFQDPFASLNPRQTIGRILTDGPVANGMPLAEAEKKARELLSLVGLDPSAYDRYPHEFSGGQRQRVGIARALALDPELLVADESVSALDVSVQAQVLDLLQDLQKKLNIAVIFITHDLRVAAEVCDKIAVMYRGAIVEFGPPGEVFNAPRHAYTQQLIAAIPGRHWNPRAAVA
ncbi:ABC transporter ATP-binding protein [Chelatococcus composti]|uniref:Peptide/nickel transport system ATP-binding protein n=1 Tax=Chelatococcus composti TaxID=1743235 RepID=A0A841K9I4_9HYPH|nr:ABC transporter ATP-binding protein [Chelatococcus composti]MBB6168770.1 peptide/nickel transport system ATP-binding protein [Chelatococcus composti]MBS7737377.1 ABC transporter ATP-binding protein [Chelatococcus composti]GGG42719.1 ABC transporter ATP-binding protein [Chelatococcus composti]